MSLASVGRQLPLLWQNPQVRKLLMRSMGLAAGVGASVAGYAYLREPLSVGLEHLQIRIPNATQHLPHKGLRILHLSDTHFQGEDWREHAKIASIRKACRNLEYDLLIHTGDFLHEDSGLPNVAALLDALPKPRLGAFAVFGNHDYMTYSHKDLIRRSWKNFSQDKITHYNGRTEPTNPWYRLSQFVQFGFFMLNVPLDLKRTGGNNVAELERALVERNFQTLHNRCIRLTHEPDKPEGVDLYIAGVDDVVEGVPDIRRALADIPYDAPTLLLSHNPDILQEPGIDQADVILAGHTHGGQIVLPLFGAAHTQSKHLARHEVSGYLQRGKTHVYITRGIGEGIPLRFGAKPQVTLITLLPD